VEIIAALEGNAHYKEQSAKIKIEHLFNEEISHLSSYLSSCERLVKQPIPLSYSRHTSRFLFLFMYSLPLVLIPYLGYFTAPTMAATFWAFVSIQEIGHFIEEVSEA
jgi:predicted membrane chloride channel (bestrophin family)